MNPIRAWWDKLSDVQKAIGALSAIAFMAFGAGVQADFVTEVPRTVRANRGLLLSIDSTLTHHRELPAHPEEAFARIRSDSLIIGMIQRGDSAIIARLEWIVCIERLDRRNPTASPAESARLCPPPGVR